MQDAKTDPAFAQDVRLVLLGDEIGAVVGGEMINRSSDCRAHFHAYLREVLAEKSQPPAFFGVEDVRELNYLEKLPSRPRDSSRDCTIIARSTSTASPPTSTAIPRGPWPNCFPARRRTPTSAPTRPCLGGQNMNHTDWFNLTRMGGASMAWGEDWASAEAGATTAWKSSVSRCLGGMCRTANTSPPASTPWPRAGRPITSCCRWCRAASARSSSTVRRAAVRRGRGLELLERLAHGLRRDRPGHLRPGARRHDPGRRPAAAAAAWRCSTIARMKSTIPPRTACSATGR